MNVTIHQKALIVDVQDEDEMEQLGRALATCLGPGSVVGLNGPLGSGKTRLARSIAEAFKVPAEAVSSPTFVLIQEYEGTLPIYHFDTYRLRSAEEFRALGPSEYFDAQGVSLVEWADRVAQELPDRAWRVAIEATGERTRRVVLQPPESDLMHALARDLACFDGGQGAS